MKYCEPRSIGDRVPPGISDPPGQTGPRRPSEGAAARMRQGEAMQKDASCEFSKDGPTPVGRGVNLLARFTLGWRTIGEEPAVIDVIGGRAASDPTTRLPRGRPGRADP